VTNLEAKDGMAIYFQRMKIEESFRDLKSLLKLNRLMHKRCKLMKKTVALVLIAYAIALVLGELPRESLFPPDSRKHKPYSGLFLFLKLTLELAHPVLSQALSAFSLTICLVRTLV
jgi:hypothetical protein